MPLTSDHSFGEVGGQQAGYPQSLQKEGTSRLLTDGETEAGPCLLTPNPGLVPFVAWFGSLLIALGLGPGLDNTKEGTYLLGTILSVGASWASVTDVA